MQKSIPFLILSVCLVSRCLAGVVNPTSRCGGFGTPIQLRINGCEGRCSFVPGTPYACEQDFMPSSAAPSLSLRVDVCLNGFCYVILEAILENSGVQPGFIYTVRYSIVPNDILSGQTIGIDGYIYKTDNFQVETCLRFEADMAELQG